VGVFQIDCGAVWGYCWGVFCGLSVHQPECWAILGQGDFASHFESMPLVERQVERIGIFRRLQNEMVNGKMV